MPRRGPLPALESAIRAQERAAGGWADGSLWSAATARNSASNWARASGAIRESPWFSTDVSPSGVGRAGHSFLSQPSAGAGEIGASRQRTPRTLRCGLTSAFGRIETDLLALDDPANLARCSGSTVPDARLLDLWPRGRPDAVPGGGSPPARVGATADAADSRLVRLLDRVPAGTNQRRLVVPRADLGAGADAYATAMLAASRPVLGG